MSSKKKSRSDTAEKTRVLTLLLALAVGACCGGPEREPLVQGEPRELEIRPSEAPRYPLDLAEGELVRVAVEQIGIDVEATLLDPRGAPILVVDSDVGYQGRELLLAVSAVAGRHWLEIQAPDDKPAGKCRVELLERHAATPADRERAQAARLLFGDGSERSPAKVIADLEEARTIWETLGEVYWLAETMKQLAERRADTGQAITLLDRSSELFAEAGELRRQAVALDLAGITLFKAGQIERANAYFERSLALALVDEDRLGQALSHYHLAIVHRLRGRFEAALQEYEKAAELWDEQLDRRWIAQTLHGQGVVYRILDEVPNARRLLEEADRIYSKLEERAQHAATLNQLGRVNQQLGELEAALAYFQRSLELRGEGSGQANTFANTGAVYQESDRPELALDSYLKALGLLPEEGRSGVLAKVRTGLGSLYNRLGQQEKAAGNLRPAVTYYNQTGDPSGEAEARLYLSMAEFGLGDLVAAHEEADRALDLVERARLGAGGPRLRSSFLSTAQIFYEHLIDVLMHRHVLTPDAGYDTRALAIHERAKARSLLELLSQAEADLQLDASPELLERERELLEAFRSEADGVRTLLDQDPGDPKETRVRELEERLLQRRVELDRLRARIRESSPRYAALTQPEPLVLSGIQSRVLDEETALLEYQLGVDRSYLWLVTSENLRTFELPGRAALEQPVRAAIRLLDGTRRPPNPEARRGELCDLGEVLLGEASEWLADRRLVIVADEVLQYLPFAALPDPREAGDCGTARPLVARHEIVYLPSATALAVLRQERPSRTPMPEQIAVIADPVFGADDERLGSESAAEGCPRYPRLLQTGKEAEEILKLVAPEHAIAAIGFDARKELVHKLGPSRIVHFATHTRFDASQPEQMSMTFSCLDSEGKSLDGHLRLVELYDLHLPAELVVLSACSTALGEEVRGEGLVGLPQAFFTAGADRLLVSLWNVGDRSTLKLMQRFYQGLLEENLEPAAALRQAQFEMWEAGAPSHRWAAFVLQGEWTGWRRTAE